MPQIFFSYPAVVAQTYELRKCLFLVALEGNYNNITKANSSVVKILITKVFFKDLDHTINLILCRTVVLKNI